MITLEQIQKKLAEAIKQSDLTQAQIAERVGIKESTLKRYVSGESKPTVFVFAKICQILHLNASEILCVKDYNSK